MYVLNSFFFFSFWRCGNLTLVNYCVPVDLPGQLLCSNLLYDRLLLLWQPNRCCCRCWYCLPAERATWLCRCWKEIWRSRVVSIGRRSRTYWGSSDRSRTAQGRGCSWRCVYSTFLARFMTNWSVCIYVWMYVCIYVCIYGCIAFKTLSYVCIAFKNFSLCMCVCIGSRCG